jgi:hypothetical protein
MSLGAITLPGALDPDALRTIALGALAVLVVLGLLVGWMVQKVVLKIVFLGVLLGVGAYVWSERAELDKCRVDHECHFAGFDVKVPAPSSIQPGP